MSNILIRNMRNNDCIIMSNAFKEQSWNKSIEHFRMYFEEQENEQRQVLVAFKDDEFLGYLTIVWYSRYVKFAEKNIPEINDLNVLIKHRKNGIATLLMDEAEKIISQKSKYSGLGVGLFSDYGNAQIMYVKRGYVPDGNGIYKNGKFLEYGETTIIDDDLNVFLIKEMANQLLGILK